MGIDWSSISAQLGVGGLLAVIIVALLLKFVDTVLFKRNEVLEGKIDKTLDAMYEVKEAVAVVETGNKDIKEQANKFYVHEWHPLVEQVKKQDRKLIILETNQRSIEDASKTGTEDV